MTGKELSVVISCHNLAGKWPVATSCHNLAGKWPLAISCYNLAGKWPVVSSLAAVAQFRRSFRYLFSDACCGRKIRFMSRSKFMTIKGLE
jgi:hypothetical protein